MSAAGNQNAPLDPDTLTMDDVKAQQDIIRCDNRQKARALANQRLVRVFGIDNIFTNANDDAYRKSFRQEAIDKMGTAINKNGREGRGSYQNLRKFADVCYDRFLEGRSGTMSLARLVQYVTLKVSLAYLFPEAKDAWDGPGSSGNITFIGERINELWIMSKNPDDTTAWVSEKKLHKALRAVTVSPRSWLQEASERLRWILDQIFGYNTSYFMSMSPDPLIPRRNPMNWLLPAYETMWRVVMRCVMEMKYRGAPKGPEWNELLQQFLRSEEDGAFSKPGKDGVSALDVVKEVLRLYPPSNSVHRQYEAHGGHTPIVLKADIKACHHSKLLGNEDPLVFRPKRWQELSREVRDSNKDFGSIMGEIKRKEEDLGFMPFAFSCPAGSGETKAFGMKMIALLTGVICNRLGNDWELEDGTCLPGIGVPLDSDRTSYLDLYLTRKL